MNFSETIREQIIKDIATQAATILTVAGYNVDLGSTVKRAQALHDKDKLPSIAVWPLPEENDSKSGRNNLTMNVRLEGLAKFGNVNPSVVAEAMLGDFIKCMANRSLTKAGGGLAESVQYKEGGTDNYPDAGQYTVGVYAIFGVTYKTNIGDPYNQ